MSIKRPDIYEHNNPDYAISDSDFVRGGIRSKVPNLPALGALASKADQLKEYATFVWVESENKYYVLVDKNNIGNINGWSSTILGSNSGGDGGVLPSVMIFRDSLETYAQLEAIPDPQQGDVYSVYNDPEPDKNARLYVRIDNYGGELGLNIWKDLGVSVDLRDYVTRYDLMLVLTDYITKEDLTKRLNWYIPTSHPVNIIKSSDIDSWNNIQVGGRNLALNSKGFLDKNSYWVRDIDLSENLVVGKEYIVTVKVASVNQIPTAFFRIGDSSGDIGNLSQLDSLTFQLKFIAPRGSNKVILFREPNDNSYYQFLSIKLEKGNKATDWTPAPEDIDYNLSTKQDKSLFSALVDKWIHFYDSVTGKMQPIIKFVSDINQLEFDGRMKLISMILPTNSNPAVANEFKSNGSRLIFANNLAVESTVAYTSDLPTTFKFTPTDNFRTSDIKTAAGNAGLIFNGLHIFIILGSNSFTCTIDNGADFPETIITIGLRKTSSEGSISFLSTRTLNAGVDNLTIMNGNENSMALINFGTSQDLLTIKNH